MALTELLAAVDFSTAAQSAARQAYALALQHGAALTLFHADQPPDFADKIAQSAALHHRGGMFVEEAFLRRRDETLREMLAELARSLGEARVKLAVARGPAADGVLRQATADRSDLVVLGPHGAGDRRHAWLGSTALDVATRAPCPVLVARPTIEGAVARHPLIALPSDRGFGAHLDLMIALASPAAELTVVHVRERHEKSSDLAAVAGLEERVRTLMAAHRAVRVQVIEATNAADAIVERVSRERHDLVVVGRSAMEGGGMRLGAVARRVLEEGGASVAIVTPR